MIPDKPEWLTPEMINSYEERMAPRYLVAAYHHFENGFDDKLDYYTLEEAEKAAQGYVDGTMEDDGFKYDGAAVYDQQEHKCIRIYGDYPDEKAHAQVRASAEPEQQEPEHFIDHFMLPRTFRSGVRWTSRNTVPLMMPCEPTMHFLTRREKPWVQ